MRTWRGSSSSWILILMLCLSVRIYIHSVWVIGISLWCWSSRAWRWRSSSLILILLLCLSVRIRIYSVCVIGISLWRWSSRAWISSSWTCFCIKNISCCLRGINFFWTSCLSWFSWKRRIIFWATRFSSRIWFLSRRSSLLLRLILQLFIVSIINHYSVPCLGIVYNSKGKKKVRKKLFAYV